jgi:hypothetical protein
LLAEHASLTNMIIRGATIPSDDLHHPCRGKMDGGEGIERVSISRGVGTGPDEITKQIARADCETSETSRLTRRPAAGMMLSFCDSGAGGTFIPFFRATRRPLGNVRAGVASSGRIERPARSIMGRMR